MAHLFQLEYVSVEVLLQLLVSIVDAELFERVVESRSAKAEVLPLERSFDFDPVFPYMSQDVAEMHFYTRAPE